MPEERKYKYNDADFDRALRLMEVVDSAKDWPKLQPFYLDAMRQLDDLISAKEEKKEPVPEAPVVKDTASKVEDEVKKPPQPDVPQVRAGQPDPRYPGGIAPRPAGYIPPSDYRPQPNPSYPPDEDRRV